VYVPGSPERIVRIKGQDADYSCLAPTFSSAEYTVINVGEEEAPRLISCVKRSQGFDWNQGTLTSPFPLQIPPLSVNAGSWVGGLTSR
jgi:hypothetical protein